MSDDQPTKVWINGSRYCRQHDLYDCWLNHDPDWTPEEVDDDE